MAAGDNPNDVKLFPPPTAFIWSTNKQLVSGGTVLTFGADPTRFVLMVHGDTAVVIFEFADDDGEPRSTFAVDDASTVRVSFFNLRAGSFTHGPMRLGTIGGLNLWVVYGVAPLPGSRHVHQITYAFYVEPPVTLKSLAEAALGG